MKASIPASFGALAACAASQNAFEPSDFNVTEALIANGVNVSALPDLAAFNEKRSLSSPCTAAVRILLLPPARTCQLIHWTV